MHLEVEHIEFIDRLREAAKEHGVVPELLILIDNSLMFDGVGNKEIVAVEAEIEFLQAAILAAKFVNSDRRGAPPDVEVIERLEGVEK